MNWTPEEFERFVREKETKTVARNRTGSASSERQDPRGGRQRARSKFNAVKTEVDGIVFDSKKEAARWGQLQLWQKSGGIRSLRRQPRYALCPLVIDGADCRDLNVGTASVRRAVVAEYVADFEYEECDHANGHSGWTLVVEDCKGMKTAIYRLKKRWFEAQYNTKIRET